MNNLQNRDTKFNLFPIKNGDCFVGRNDLFAMTNPPIPPFTKWRLRGNYGFTLLELMISIVLLGIIIVIIAGAMRLGFRSVDSGEKKIESLERMRASLDIIDSQIQSQIPLTYDEEGERKYYFSGERDSLQFSTNYSIWGGQKGYVIVTYEVSSEGDGKPVLYASENIVGIEGSRVTKLLDAFDAIYFEYYYKDITAEEGNWVEQWTDSSTIPEKIKVHLVTGERDLSIIIPVRIGTVNDANIIRTAFRRDGRDRRVGCDINKQGMDDLRRNREATTSEKGIALLMVLWVLTILMVLVLSFSFMTRTETYATLSFKERAEKKFLAEAGIERAIMELFYRNVNKNQSIVLEGREVWKIDGTSYKSQMGEGEYSVRITDESGKININTITDANSDILRNLLKNLGVPEEEVNTIVDSILDWKDADDLHHLSGAESDYYMSLPNPYKAKNANFDTLEELLLVKGMTPEILYGEGDKRGIIDFLTVNSKNSKINVNAAPKEVLMAIPGITPEIADGIISYRENKEINSAGDVGIPGESGPYISYGDSNTFTIDSVGHKGNAKAGFDIRATVIIEGNNKYRYVYYKSPANRKQ